MFGGQGRTTLIVTQIDNFLVTKIYVDIKSVELRGPVRY